jgi:RES domain-containing protein
MSAGPDSVVAWRIVRSRHARAAFSGIGAQLVGGRFNSVGTPVVYTADSYALALLEVRVHVASFRGMRDRVALRVEVDSELIERVAGADLPADWQARPAARAAQRFGDAWARSGRSAVLAVPSVVAPEHVNYLINSQHPQFARLRIGDARPVEIDPRLDE